MARGFNKMSEDTKLTKAERREKKKKIKMKVNGNKIKQLLKIIINKK